MNRPNLPVLVFFIVLGLVWLVPPLLQIDPMATEPGIQLQPPTRAHLLGTDLLGRDILSRTLYGGRRSLGMAVLSTGGAVSVGLVLGLVSGLAVRWVDRLVAALVNSLLAIPGLVIALVVITIMGNNTGGLVLAIGVAQIAPVATVIRSAVLATITGDYVDAAFGLGATRFHVLIYHILPNILSVALAYTGVVFSYSLLNGAALTFLGVGGEPGVPDWGAILADGRAAFRTAPWIALAPGLMMTLTVWSVNSLVDRITVSRQSW